jgi:hypothetical protein
MPSSEISNVSRIEVERMLQDDDLELSFTAASQFYHLPRDTSKLPPRPALSGVFENLEIGSSSPRPVPRNSPGVSSITAGTSRTVGNVAPAVVREMQENTAEAVEFDDFIAALRPSTDAIQHSSPTQEDILRVSTYVQQQWRAYSESTTKADEKLQYQPFSQLCNAITQIVPASFTAPRTLFTIRNDPQRLMSSREEAWRIPDVITVGY